MYRRETLACEFSNIVAFISYFFSDPYILVSLVKAKVNVFEESSSLAVKITILLLSFSSLQTSLLPFHVGKALYQSL